MAVPNYLQSGFEVRDCLLELLKLLFTAESNGVQSLLNKGTLLVVPFDDVDLQPEHLRGILDILPVLGSLPGIAVIIAADMELMRRRLRRESDEFFSVSSNIQVQTPLPSIKGARDNNPKEPIDDMTLRTVAAARLTEDQLGKRFPWDMRVDLAEMSLRERLDFCPPGSSHTLCQLFQKIPLTRSKLGPQTFADFFDMSWNYSPMSVLDASSRLSHYAHILPSNPRSLTGLHGMVFRHVTLMTAAAQNTDPFPSDVFKQMFHAFMRDFIHFLAQRHPELLSVIEELFRFDEADHEVTIDASGIKGYVAMQRLAGDTSKWEVLILKRHRALCKGRNLSRAATALVSFASEVICWPIYYGLNEAYSREGGIEDSVKPFRCGDSRFGWPLPCFDSLLIYDAWQLRWTTATRMILQAEIATGMRDIEPAKVLWLFWVYCQNMVDAVRNGAPQLFFNEIGTAEPSQAQWGTVLADIQEVLRSCATSPLNTDMFGKSVASDLRTWVALYLPFIFHKEAGMPLKVAEAARFLWTSMRSSSEELGFSKDVWEVSLRNAENHVERIRQPLPEVDLENVDWKGLLNGIMRREEDAVATANYLLTVTKEPNPRLAQLAEFMSRIGLKIPSAEKTIGSRGGSSLADETEQRDRSN